MGIRVENVNFPATKTELADAEWQGYIDVYFGGQEYNKVLASIFHDGPVWGWSAPVASRLF